MIGAIVMMYLVYATKSVHNSLLWNDSRTAASVRLYLLCLAGLSFVIFAAPHAESSTVVYSSTTCGTLYCCGPDPRVSDDADRYVTISKIDLIKSTGRVDFIVPVHQHFTRHAFRWRLAEGSLFLLTGTIYPVRQDSFTLHRIPLADLPKHRRDKLRLPRRQDFADYSSYEKAWSEAIAAPTATDEARPLGGPYAICDPAPLFGAFIHSDGVQNFSFDFSLSPAGDATCFTYARNVLKESTANLRKIEGSPPYDPHLWHTVRSQQIEMDERFWVFRPDSSTHFVTESGRLLFHKPPDEPRLAEAFANSRIVCVVDDADSGRTFAFSRKGYCELKQPLHLTAYELPSRDEDHDRLLLAARCARLLIDAGRLKPPRKMPSDGGRK